jgi:hypothetical protein
VTTSHLFWPNQRREQYACYQTGYGIQLSCALQASTKPAPPGGVRLRHIRRKPRRKSAHGIFAVMDPFFHALERNSSATNPDRTQPQVVRLCVSEPVT